MLQALSRPRRTVREAEGQSGRLLRRGLGTGLLVLTLAAGTSNLALARSAPDNLGDLAEKVSPAVVNIQVKQTAGAEQMAEMGPGGEGLPFGPDGPLRDFMERFFGEQMPGVPQGQNPGGQVPRGAPQHRGTPHEMSAVGSGFIIDADGYVVTNHHVVDQASDITVTLTDGVDYAAELIGSDQRTDLALLKVKSDKPLPHVSWGDSDKMRPGDWVMAVGNPFGLGGTVTAGIVSARGRDLPGGNLIDYLQIDASINRGNSGGPSFDTEGNVIGVNSAIYSPNGGSVGIGFAIPSNLARTVIAELRDKGHVDRGWLGVQIQGVTPELAEGLGLDQAKGALVAAITPDSPAEQAKLKAGDVILSWDGKPVDELKDLPKLVANTKAGDKVGLQVWRDRKEIEISVETGKMPLEQEVAANDDQQPSANPQAGAVDLAGTGLTLGDLTAQDRARYGIPESSQGALVVGVAPDSAAAQEGLREGDVVASLALAPVNSAKAAGEAFEEARSQGQKVVTLMVNRGEEQRFVALRLGQA